MSWHKGQTADQLSIPCFFGGILQLYLKKTLDEDLAGVLFAGFLVGVPEPEMSETLTNLEDLHRRRISNNNTQVLPEV